MNKFYRIASAIAITLASVGAHAAHHDFHFFSNSTQGKCISKSHVQLLSNCYNSEGEKTEIFEYGRCTGFMVREKPECHSF